MFARANGPRTTAPSTLAPAADMKRIEMLGPMGAGKSALVEAIRRHAAKRLPLQTAAEAKTALLVAEAGRRSPLHEVALRLLSQHRATNAAFVTDKITASAWSALEARSHDFYPLLHYVLRQRSGDLGQPARALRRTYWFIRDVTDVALFEERRPAGFVLHDESLLQRGLAFGFGEADAQAQVERYMELAPLPAAVLHVTAPADMLAKRVARRDRDLGRHLCHIEQAFELSMHASASLRRRGVCVIELDGLDDLEANVRHALHALRGELGP